jgi:hypothetical protein
MKAAIVIAATLATLPLAAAAASPLAGVSDEETRISSGEIREYHRGNGDVMFMRDRENKWFRVEFNPGCLRARPIRGRCRSAPKTLRAGSTSSHGSRSMEQ